MAKREEQEQPAEREQAAQRRLYNLVVIGSSAGGIEALSTVVKALGSDFPVPVVIAQHLDPRHTSHLQEILTAHGALPVRTVAEQQPLAPGTVYVVPADRNVEIIDGHLHLLTDALPRPKPSINLLLSTAAAVYGESLIAVILTGTGSDGTEGARRVKDAGGTVIIENPETAAFSGMPASLAPSTVDLVADLGQIGPLLSNLLDGTYAATLPEADEEANLEDAREQALQSVLAQVREFSGVDFSSYKRPTILRRLHRRMVATNASDLSEYSLYLASHVDEYQRLTSSFLIKVTEFFRDPDLFNALRERVIPDLIAQARLRGNLLRIWSAGCATGEEAYSLAILVAEALGDELAQFQVQIFATDLDEDAIAFARRGTYPLAALSGVPEDLIARYFLSLDSTREVTKRLRGMIIFGQHDLGQRAPFPRIDLVLCRNVLIYFTRELQARALQLFAFALRDGGYLALGKAETTNPLEAYFLPIDARLKLYRRQGERLLVPISNPSEIKDLMPRLHTSELHDLRRSALRQNIRPSAQWAPQVSPPEKMQESAHDATLANANRARSAGEWLGNLVLSLPLGVVVVDRRYDIQEINGVALRQLGIYSAALGEDLIHLTQSVPGDALRTVIDAAFQRTRPTREREAAADNDSTVTAGKPDGAEAVVTLETVLGERRHLHVSCYPSPGTRMAGGEGRHTADGEVMLILIEDITSAVAEQERMHATVNRQQAEEQANQAREQSDQERNISTIQEENERLKAEISRIEGINRSLLEANQDLTDTVMNLRRNNEELAVGHEEAEANAEEVKTLNEEMQATNEELVTINEELEATVEELHTANSDIEARSRELQESSETLIAERATSEAARTQLEAILLSLGDGVLVVDHAGAIVLTNAAYERMFDTDTAGFVAEDEDGHPLPTAATPQQRAARGETFTMGFSLTDKDGMRRWFEATGQPIRNLNEKAAGVVAIRDITERSIYRFQDEFMKLVSHELRTPLTPLSTYLQSLGKLFADQPEGSRTRFYIERSQHQVQQIQRLLQDLLDIGRLRNNTFQLDLKRVTLDQVVASTVEVAGTMTTAHTIRLKLPDTPVVIECDSTRLEQVLLNLLTNVFTHAQGSKDIDVRLRRVGNEAEIQVQDYGGGIPAAALPHIFSRFFQVSRTDADRPSRRGLGLGLYITQKLVEGHGGRIEVTSVEAPNAGHGTTFTIHLPLAPEETVSAPEIKQSHAKP